MTKVKMTSGKLAHPAWEVALYRPPLRAEIYGLPTSQQYVYADPTRAMRAGELPERLDGGDSSGNWADWFGDNATPKLIPFPWAGIWFVPVYSAPTMQRQYVPAFCLTNARTGEPLSEAARKWHDQAA